MTSTLSMALRINVIVISLLAVFGVYIVIYRYRRRQKVPYKPPYGLLLISQAFNILYGGFDLYVTHRIVSNLIVMSVNAALMVGTLYGKWYITRLWEERKRLYQELIKEAEEKQRTAFPVANEQAN